MYGALISSAFPFWPNRTSRKSTDGSLDPMERSRNVQGAGRYSADTHQILHGLVQGGQRPLEMIELVDAISEVSIGMSQHLPVVYTKSSP
jgi:hypothetical protein